MQNVNECKSRATIHFEISAISIFRYRNNISSVESLAAIGIRAHFEIQFVSYCIDFFPPTNDHVCIYSCDLKQSNDLLMYLKRNTLKHVNGVILCNTIIVANKYISNMRIYTTNVQRLRFYEFENTDSSKTEF